MTAAASPPRYSVKAATLEQHAEDVVSLWETALYPGEAGQRKIRWMYASSPAGAGLLFLLDADGSGPVGVTGIGQRTFMLGDETVRAGIMADFTVAPEHRSLMPALKLLRASVAQSVERFDFLYSLPNERAEAVFIRAGYRKRGEMIRYARPTRSARFLESRTAGLWARIAAPLVDAALLARDLARRRRVPARFRYGARSDFNASFDSLWARRLPGAALISVRSRETLAWRFLDKDPSPDWRVTTVHDESSNELRAYAVWGAQAGAAQIADFLWSDDSAGAALLEQVTWEARSAACSSVSLEFFGSADVTALLKAAGFWPRETSPVYHVPAKPDLAQFDGDWYLTTFDRD